MEKSTRISLRLSEEELEIIRQNAGKVSLNVSDYIRKRSVQEMEQILYDPEIRDTVLEALSLLREMGSYIHTLGQGSEQESRFKDLNSKLAEAVGRLCNYLKGGTGNHGSHETFKD